MNTSKITAIELQTYANNLSCLLMTCNFKKEFELQVQRLIHKLEMAADEIAQKETAVEGE